MSSPWRCITVAPDVARALQHLAIADLRGYTVLPNGNVTFEIDPEVAAELDRRRLPRESDSDLLRRIIREETGVAGAPRKPN